jgi:hypothetical protein
MLAGALGIMFGTIFMAFHGSQGPEMGLPQMIQSRAQFGYRGVILRWPTRCSPRRRAQKVETLTYDDSYAVDCFCFERSGRFDVRIR